MKKTPAITPLQAWLQATRPRTLPAAVAPVMVGTALALADGFFAWLPALATLACALLLQIGVNLANDYFDFIKGVDSADRLGPVRVTQSGLMAPAAVRRGMLLVLGLAVAAGIYLIHIGGLPIFLAGLAAVICVLIYSGGPFPLASNGLGDLAVFIFFGPVAVGGTYYLQALDVGVRVLPASLSLGFLITAILVVNNLRDIDTDRRAGKLTLAVRLGLKGARIEYMLLICGAYVIPVAAWLAAPADWGQLPALLSLPLAFRRVAEIRIIVGTGLNRVLAETAMVTLVYSLLMSMGIVLAGC
jgi:1,4-dihydroxy-2-naphthoate polyprenyltransferase